jgi:integrase/recombinase XerD
VDLVEGGPTGRAGRAGSALLHTTRHLCLTDLARMGWELHAIATFAGHRSTESTLRYIHLSGRELAVKLNRSMAHLHAQRVAMLTATGPEALETGDKA